MKRAALLIACAACGAVDRAPPAPISPAPLATVPQKPFGALAPSLVRRVEAESQDDGARIADVDACGNCHADVANAWRKSAHAFASFNNPVYRVAVERLRSERGDQTSQFCGGCHDIALLVDGAMLGRVAETDLRAHAGVTCATCHGIAEARADGNASYDLDTSPIPIPRDGDPESLLRHRARVGRATLRTSAMCGTCHKAFLDRDTGNAAHLTGQDDATPWARSSFAGSHGARIDDAPPPRDCRSCHMPRVPAVLGDPGAKNGTVASHAFLGGHTWLAAMQNDPELLARARAFLTDRISIDIGGVRHGDRIDLAGGSPVVLAPSERVVLDVVVRNRDVGHRFPGGVMDAQDTWIELRVEDARGARVADAGVEHERTGADPSAHTFASYMAREDGSRLLLRETHSFRAGVYNHTIAPRDAAVVQYAFDAPRDAYPLRVTARVRHRSRNLMLQRAACADARSERGRLFGRVGLRDVARAIDPCRAEPVTDLATTTILLSGPGAPRPAPRASFDRAYGYALGLSHALQERLDDARGPLDAALEEARSSRDRALVWGLRAQIAARQARAEETFDAAARADAEALAAGLPSPHPAMDRARADVLASGWRLAEAAPLFDRAARGAPRDDAAWAQAAIAFGSIGDRNAALEAARMGLAMQPRDADMLRVQALAVSDPEADAAFLERRAPDDAPSIRAKCSARVPGCAIERIPVHVHTMR
jgi:tetratricopeptide (TPR) repeat protein